MDEAKKDEIANDYMEAALTDYKDIPDDAPSSLSADFYENDNDFDYDYANDDRETCATNQHPFSYVGSFGPSCGCGERVGGEFSPEDIARGALNNAIWRHDREQKA